MLKLTIKSPLLVVAVFMLAFTLFQVQSAKAETQLLEDPPIIKTAKSGNIDSMTSYLLRGAHPGMSDGEGKTGLMIATQNEDIDIIELLLSYQALIDQQDKLGNTALFYAASRGLYSSVEVLLEHGANPDMKNRQGVTPMMVGATSRDTSIVELLLNANPDLTLSDYTGRSVLEWSRNSGNAQIEDMLRAAGATD